MKGRMKRGEKKRDMGREGVESKSKKSTIKTIQGTAVTN